MATYKELMEYTLELVKDCDDFPIKDTLRTLSYLDEPEDEMDSWLRSFVVDRAVQEYFKASKVL